MEPSQRGPLPADTRPLALLNGGAPLGWGAAQGKVHPRLTAEQGMATDNVQKRRLFRGSLRSSALGPNHWPLLAAQAEEPGLPGFGSKEGSGGARSAYNYGIVRPSMAAHRRSMEGGTAFADKDEWCPVAGRLPVLD